jgi:hypothetical protein
MNVEVLGDDISYGSFLPGLRQTAISVGGKIRLARAYAELSPQQRWAQSIGRPANKPSIPPVARLKIPAAAYGFGADAWYTTLAKTVVSDVIKVGVPAIAQRLTPTQKAYIQQVTPVPSSMPYQPAKPDFMKEYGPYVIIGSALLVGTLVMMKTRRSRR